MTIKKGNEMDCRKKKHFPSPNQKKRNEKKSSQRIPQRLSMARKNNSTPIELETKDLRSSGKYEKNKTKKKQQQKNKTKTARFTRGKPDFDWSLLRLLSCFRGFDWLLLGFTGFYRVLLGFTGFY